jgi:hypothetical protein
MGWTCDALHIPTGFARSTRHSTRNVSLASRASAQGPHSHLRRRGSRPHWNCSTYWLWEGVLMTEWVSCASRRGSCTCLPPASIYQASATSSWRYQSAARRWLPQSKRRSSKAYRCRSTAHRRIRPAAPRFEAAITRARAQRTSSSASGIRDPQILSAFLGKRCSRAHR